VRSGRRIWPPVDHFLGRWSPWRCFILLCGEKLCILGAIMRLFLVTSLTMVAFAANSILNRFALADHLIGPAGFGVLRLLSGAVMLALLVAIGERKPVALTEVSPFSVLGLSAYVLGFAYAYITLPAGIGALILFGVVQVTMFAGALILGERPGRFRWIGAGVAFAGLIYLLAPSVAAPDPLGAALMALAGVGWGYYSIYGRTVTRPLHATAANFLFATPVAALVWAIFPDPVVPGVPGAGLAILSGAVTSGLGYALWYSVLPKLDTSLAAIAQVTVPVIAAVGGILFLSEAMTLNFAISSVLVLGGIALSIRRG